MKKNRLNEIAELLTKYRCEECEAPNLYTPTGKMLKQVQHDDWGVFLLVG